MNEDHKKAIAVDAIAQYRMGNSLNQLRLRVSYEDSAQATQYNTIDLF